MSANLNEKLVIGISSRALFDLDESNEVFEHEGVDSYAKYQIEHENEILRPGVAFNFVKKLLNLNQHGPFVEVILLSRNSADTGLRIFNSIQHYNLEIKRAAFTGGESPFPYITPFGSHLFLSANSEDVLHALAHNCAAATLLPTKAEDQGLEDVRIAFDGDSVLFSDESERIFQKEGQEGFTKNELRDASRPMSDGPFAGFLKALHFIQRQFPEKECPIRTALVTARQAPAHERVIRTLRSWDIRIDEALFLGGLPKYEFLKSFGADVFFDDHPKHCELAAKAHVTTGHVPHGIVNEIKAK